MTDAEQQSIANIEHESHMKGFEVGRDIGRQEERSRLIALAEEIAGDPPLESNERRRGFQEFADTFITRANQEEK